MNFWNYLFMYVPFYFMPCENNNHFFKTDSLTGRTVVICPNHLQLNPKCLIHGNKLKSSCDVLSRLSFNAICGRFKATLGISLSGQQQVCSPGSVNQSGLIRQLEVRNK